MYLYLRLASLIVDVIKEVHSEAAAVLRRRKLRHDDFIVVRACLVLGVDVVRDPAITVYRVLVVTTKENILD